MPFNIDFLAIRKIKSARVSAENLFVAGLKKRYILFYFCFCLTFSPVLLVRGGSSVFRGCQEGTPLQWLSKTNTLLSLSQAAVSVSPQIIRASSLKGAGVEENVGAMFFLEAGFFLLLQFWQGGARQVPNPGAKQKSKKAGSRVNSGAGSSGSTGSKKKSINLQACDYGACGGGEGGGGGGDDQPIDRTKYEFDLPNGSRIDLVEKIMECLALLAKTGDLHQVMKENANIVNNGIISLRVSINQLTERFDQLNERVNQLKEEPHSVDTSDTSSSGVSTSNESDNEINTLINTLIDTFKLELAYTRQELSRDLSSHQVAVDGLIARLTHLEETQAVFQRSMKSRMIAIEQGSAPQPVSVQNRNLPVQADGVLVWKIDQYHKRKQDAMVGTASILFSPPFWTDTHGYKCRAKVYLNGGGIGKGAHLSLFFQIMKGDYDALLAWPFNKKVTMMLLDQCNRYHKVTVFHAGTQGSSFQRPAENVNDATGLQDFITHKELENLEKGYLVDDTIFIKIIIND